MPTSHQLRIQGLELCDKMADLVKDGRPWNAAKKSQLDKLDGDINAVRTQYEALKAVDGDPFMRGYGGGASEDPGARGHYSAKGIVGGLIAQGYKPVGSPQLDLSDEDVRDLHEAAVSHKSFGVNVKTPTDSSSIPQSLITDYHVQPLAMRREPTRVLSLIPTLATDHPSVTWYTTTGSTAAAAVAEGGTKPTSTIAYTAVTGTVTKIAHVAEVTDETILDFPSFMGVLQQDMFAGLVKAENAELLTATVTGAHKFAGLLNTSGILSGAVPGSPTATDRLDSISVAFDALRTGASFADPDGIVMHPTDWGTIRRNKDSQNRYLLGDPGTGTDPRIWGVPVVLTTQITQGTALIGNFRESVVAYVRDGIRLDTANQGSTQFTTNTTLVRAEERLLLTVPRPAGLYKLTGL